MGSRESEGRRAQLWAIYFQLRALPDPPPFLRRAEEDLRRLLSIDDPDGEPPAIVRRGHLRRLK